MIFNEHSNLEGCHAFFSPSQPYWLGYDENRAIEVYENSKRKEIGTRLHAFAKEAIDLGIKLPRSKKTLNAYVNDAIGFRMSTEVVLYYSRLFFGTADAIIFKDDVLRIHDLKTGVGKVHPEQLLVYAALFCLEYRIDPFKIKTYLRIYQNDDHIEIEPEPEEIKTVMLHIIQLNKTMENVGGAEQ